MLELFLLIERLSNINTRSKAGDGKINTVDVCPYFTGDIAPLYCYIEFDPMGILLITRANIWLMCSIKNAGTGFLGMILCYFLKNCILNFRLMWIIVALNFFGKPKNLEDLVNFFRTWLILLLLEDVVAYGARTKASGTILRSGS